MDKENLDSWVNEVQGFIDKDPNRSYKLYDFETSEWNKMVLSLGLIEVNPDDIYFCSHIIYTKTKDYIVEKIMENNSHVEDQTGDYPKLVIVRF